jgi:hypothetical protein
MSTWLIVMAGLPRLLQLPRIPAWLGCGWCGGVGEKMQGAIDARNFVGLLHNFKVASDVSAKWMAKGDPKHSATHNLPFTSAF